MKLMEPFLLGLVLTIVAYGIIKASHNNPKVIKILTIIAMSITFIVAVILLAFLILALV